MQTESNLFLSTVFAKKPPESFILIWSKSQNHKESRWYQNPTETSEILQFNNTNDIYFGVGLSPENYGPYRRCLVADILGIPGFWLDMDIMDGIHKGENLPPTIEDCINLLDELEYKPSIIVKTGGGLQAYWLFNNLWRFVDNFDREKAIEASKKWIYRFKELAAAHGWHIDPTQDLARVMRLPGTFNHKGPEPRPVEIIAWSDIRYEAQELVDSVWNVELPNLPAKRSENALKVDYKGDYKLDSGNIIDGEQFETLMDLNPKLRQSWNHKRRDLVDQSCSVYDLSIAAILKISCGLEDQAIIDVLQAHRRRYGRDDLKIARRDYYDRTMSNVYRMITPEEIPAEILEDQIALDADDPVDQAPEVEQSAVDALDQRRAEILASIGRDLGFKVAAFVRVHAEPIYFRLDLENGQKVKLGGSAVVFNQNQFRAKVSDETLLHIPKKTKVQWESLVGKLISPKVVTEEFPDPLETSVGFLRFWIPQYLIERPALDHTDPAVILEQANFEYAGAPYIQFAGFQSWLKRKDQDLKKLTHEGLRAAGLVSEKRSVKKTSVYGWRLPEDLI